MQAKPYPRAFCAFAEVLDRVRARRLSTGALQHTQPVVQPSQPAAQEYDQSTEDSPAGAGPSSAPTITLQSATLQPSRAPSASLSAQATPRLQAYPPASAQFKAHPRTDVVSHAISTAATTPEKALPDSVQNSPGLHARNSPTPPPPAPQAQEQPPQTARGPHQAPQSQDDSSNAPQPRADEALVIKGVAGPPAVQPAQANGNATHTVPREGPVASGSTAATCAMEQHKHGQAVTCVSEPMTAAPSPAAVANEPQGPQSPPAASRPPLPRPSSDTAPSAPAIPAANISPAASPAATAAAAAAPAATQADPASPLTQPQQPASSGAAAAAPSPAGTPKKQVAAPAAAAAGQDSCVPSPSAPAAADDVPGWLAMVRKLRDALPVGALSPLSRRRNKRATHPAEAAAADSNTNKSASGKPHHLNGARPRDANALLCKAGTLSGVDQPLHVQSPKAKPSHVGLGTILKPVNDSVCVCVFCVCVCVCVWVACHRCCAAGQGKPSYASHHTERHSQQPSQPR